MLSKLIVDGDQILGANHVFLKNKVFPIWGNYQSLTEPLTFSTFFWTAGVNSDSTVSTVTQQSTLSTVSTLTEPVIFEVNISTTQSVTNFSNQNFVALNFVVQCI